MRNFKSASSELDLTGLQGPPRLPLPAAVPGFPRYTVTGNSSTGWFNLTITAARLEDEGEFECQVNYCNNG